MVFSSLTFIFFFFPLVFISYFVVKHRKWRNGVLLVFSLLFYSWGEPKNIILMLLATLVAYTGGLMLDACGADEIRKRKAILTVTIILLLSNLFVFKYLNFAADNVMQLFGKESRIQRIKLPIGISFYTFQILSYVIDLNRHKVKVQKNFLKLLLYVSLFPQLIAGPIVRYETVEQEIDDRHENFEDVIYGFQRFIIGFAKKVLLANNVSAAAQLIYSGNPQEVGTLLFWIAGIADMIQIYFDFSGYSDMAIGMGRMFGFHFHENFNHPYVATSMADYWRRWHISLTTWFKDYVYFPLGGSRVSTGRWIFNTMLVWGLTGLWHGAEWTYLFWGLYYGVMIILEKKIYGQYLKKLPHWLQWLINMFIIIIGYIMFNADSVAEFGTRISYMFTYIPTDWTAVAAGDLDVFKAFIWIPLGILFTFPVLEKMKPKNPSPAIEVTEYVLYAALFILCIVFLLSTTYNPFLYFRF